MLVNPATHPLSPLLAAALVAAGPVSAQSGETDLAGIACFFAAAQVAEGPELVDCTLSRGTETTRFSITIRPNP
jgi:hypothetical protein